MPRVQGLVPDYRQCTFAIVLAVAPKVRCALAPCALNGALYRDGEALLALDGGHTSAPLCEGEGRIGRRPKYVP